jgi:hypothetical protein
MLALGLPGCRDDAVVRGPTPPPRVAARSLCAGHVGVNPPFHALDEFDVVRPPSMSCRP